jgi:hypothetical protein
MSLTNLFNQIVWNLDMISSLGNNQTFYVVDTKLFIENRTMAGYWRSGETRVLILDAVEYTWTSIDELLTSYQNTNFLQPHIFYESRKNDVTEKIKSQLQEFVNKEEKVLEGLNRLATFTRYQTDSSFLVRIGRMIAEFKRLCLRANSLSLKQIELKSQVNEILQQISEEESF